MDQICQPEGLYFSKFECVVRVAATLGAVPVCDPIDVPVSACTSTIAQTQRKDD
jgi:hypothetical protein